VAVEGVEVSPRKLLAAVAAPRLAAADEPDVVVLRGESIGRKDGRPTILRHEMMDLRDERTGLSAMMRTTSFPVSVAAQMLAAGIIDRRGAFPPEKIVPPAVMLSELERRGIFVRRLVAAVELSEGRNA
jgi:lysine 6-dehydrogenase